MCRWMGSHFHNWMDYHGVPISIVNRMGSHIFRFLGKTVLHIYGLQTYQNVCSVVENIKCF